MIKLAADLHIHSCLSPCCDDDMTPNNLVNMAYVKRLEAIALTDHNTAKNLPAAKAVADARGLVFLPGIEVETREEVHVLTYFETVEQAMDFGEYIYKHLPDIENMPDFFGAQFALDENDAPIYEEKRMLLQAVTLSIEEVAAACRARGGVPVPAHINRASNSLLYNLGFIPPDLDFASVEVYKHSPIEGVDLSPYHVIYNSDAHRLQSISEAENHVFVREKSAAGILAFLREKK
ncbi:MAG: PHP domain-containing protein [Clostridiales bacterium]|jgi:hypothetical protein|nr:PHP domain-containing protein [Clostridiales bacterium]